MKNRALYLSLCLALGAGLILSSCKKDDDDKDPSINGNEIPTTGLMAYFPFSGNLNDESGNNVEAVGNGVTLTTDRHGNADRAYLFDGTSNIQIPDQGYFNNMPAYTAAAWVYPTSEDSKRQIICKGDPLRDIALKIDQVNQLQCHFQTADFSVHHAYCPGEIAPNNWYHCAAVWTGTHLRIYKNGLLSNEVDFTGEAIPWTGEHMTIGSLVDSEYFIGKIDEVVIYNRALTGEEIQILASK